MKLLVTGGAGFLGSHLVERLGVDGVAVDVVDDLSTGSLTNLLWRRTLGRRGVHPSNAEFHRVSLLLTPPSLLTAVVVLWLTG